MGLQDLLNRLAGRREERANRQRQAYAELIAAISDGKEPKVDELERILDEAGKTPAQLRTDLQTFLDRRKWAAEIEGEAMWQAELQELDRRQAEADQLLAETRERCYAEGLAVREARQRVESKLARIHHARIQLHNSSPDDNRQTRMELARQTGPVVSRLEAIERELREARAHFEAHSSAKQKGHAAPNIDDAIGAARVRVERLEKEKAAAAERLESVRRESETLSAAALVP